MDVFENDKYLKLIREEINNNNTKIFNDAAKIKKIQEKIPEFKDMYENYDNIKKQKISYIEKLLQYLEEQTVNFNLLNVKNSEIKHQKTILIKILEKLQKN